MSILEYLNENKEIAATFSTLITGASAAIMRCLEKSKIEKNHKSKILKLELDLQNLNQENENLINKINFQRNLIQHFIEKNEKETN